MHSMLGYRIPDHFPGQMPCLLRKLTVTILSTCMHAWRGYPPSLYKLRRCMFIPFCDPSKGLFCDLEVLVVGTSFSVVSLALLELGGSGGTYVPLVCITGLLSSCGTDGCLLTTSEMEVLLIGELDGILSSDFTGLVSGLFVYWVVATTCCCCCCFFNEPNLKVCRGLLRHPVRNLDTNDINTSAADKNQNYAWYTIWTTHKLILVHDQYWSR